MKQFFQIFIISAVAFTVGAAASAAEIESFSFDNPTQTIQISGLCGGHSVTILISAASAAGPLYTAGGECRDGQFVFEDKLDYWNFPAGEYRLVTYDANSPLSNPSEEKIFTIEIPPEQYLPDEPVDGSATSTDEEPQKDEPDNHFFTQFIDILVEWLKNVILKIKELAVEKITTSNLCVGETCVNEDDLKKILESKNKQHNKPEENKPGEEIKPPEDNTTKTDKSENEEQINFTEPQEIPEAKQETPEAKNEEKPPPNIISGGEDVSPNDGENKHDILPASDAVDGALPDSAQSE